MSTTMFPDAPLRDGRTPGGQGDSSTLSIYVVDEEDPITQLLSIALGLEGWSVSRFPTGHDAIQAVLADAPDAILLDMMLPDMSGVEVVSRVRAAGVTTPVLFLTGRSSLEDRLAAYAAGADDYLTKPFGLEEVVTTLTALFRKQGKLPTSITRGDLVLDTRTKQAWLDGMPLMLAPMDFVVVCELAERRTGRATRRILVDRLTDAGFDFIAPNDLLNLPAVTGAGPGGMRSAILRVSGNELVLMDSAR
jgi:two-component system OmpR family response regulator